MLSIFNMKPWNYICFASDGWKDSANLQHYSKNISFCMTLMDIFDADTWTFLVIFGAIWIFLVSFGYLWWHLIFLVAFGYLWLRCDARRWRTCSRKCKYRSLRPTLPRIRPLAKKTAGTSLKLCFRKIFSIVDKMISKKYAHPTILIWGTALGNRTPLHNREAAICCNILWRSLRNYLLMSTYQKCFFWY